MGLITAKIGLSNPTMPANGELEVSCLVDTGALHLCLPEKVAIQLGYIPDNPAETKEITTADGKKHFCPYVGPIRISFKNRTGFVGAVVLGQEVLLGAIPMEDLDLVVILSKLTIDVNPSSPYVASSQAKAFSQVRKDILARTKIRNGFVNHGRNHSPLFLRQERN